MSKSIGAIEFRSISKGIEVSNEIVKKSSVNICFLKSICIGKFLIIISGDVSEVEEAIKYGLSLGGNNIIDSFIVNAVEEEIINGLKNRYTSKEVNSAIGVMETTKVCSGIKALDKTLKSSDVRLVKLQLATFLGGKLVYIITGDLSSVEYALNEGKCYRS